MYSRQVLAKELDHEEIGKPVEFDSEGYHNLTMLFSVSKRNKAGDDFNPVFDDQQIIFITGAQFVTHRLLPDTVITVWEND